MGAIVPEQVGRERGHRDLAALLLEQRRRPQADGSQADHDRAVAGEVARLRDPRDRRGRGRVAAVRVDHHRDAEGAEERLLHLVEDLLAGGHVLAADPHGHRLEVVRPAGEERVLRERARGLGLHVAVREQDVDAGVVRDDRVERARVLVGVELEQDFLHDSSLRAVRRTRSRRGSSKVR